MIYSEVAFPVAELARELSRWLHDGLSEPFRFTSLLFQEGVVTISQAAEGWVVSSIFVEDSSQPVDRATLEAAIRDFVDRVKADVTALGLDTDRLQI